MAYGAEIYNSSGDLIVCGCLKNLAVKSSGSISMSYSATYSAYITDSAMPSVATGEILLIRTSTAAYMHERFDKLNFLISPTQVTIHWVIVGEADTVTEDLSLAFGVQVFNESGVLTWSTRQKQIYIDQSITLASSTPFNTTDINYTLPTIQTGYSYYIPYTQAVGASGLLDTGAGYSLVMAREFKLNNTTITIRNTSIDTAAPVNVWWDTDSVLMLVKIKD